MPDLELKIHPPIVMLLCAVLAWGMAQMTPSLSFHLANLQWALFLLLVASGVAIAISAVLRFHRAETTIHPTNPNETARLVTSGIYRFTRNPMYLGLLLLLSGWNMMLGNLASLISLVAFVTYINRFQILPEERILKAKFGAEYETFCHKVRRWI